MALDDNTQRNKGVEDRVYAVVKEATRLYKGDPITGAPGDPTNDGYFAWYKQALSIGLDFANMWSPLFQAGAIDERAIALAQTIAEGSGRANCLDVEDTIIDRTAGNQDEFLSGGVLANVGAYGEDVGETVSDAAGAVYQRGESVITGAQESLKWLTILLVVVVVLYVVVRR